MLRSMITESGYWKILDSEKGVIDTGWASYRPAPYVIITTYHVWDINPLPNLRAYYKTHHRKINIIMRELEQDHKCMNENYLSLNFNRYYPCIKNYLKKLHYTGVLQ